MAQIAQATVRARFQFQLFNIISDHVQSLHIMICVFNCSKSCWLIINMDLSWFSSCLVFWFTCSSIWCSLYSNFEVASDYHVSPLCFDCSVSLCSGHRNTIVVVMTLSSADLWASRWYVLQESTSARIVATIPPTNTVVSNNTQQPLFNFFTQALKNSSTTHLS